MDRKAEFLKIWTERVRREYADDLLAWLERETDFFEAPASTRHHGAHPGGLLDHSLNVYHRLRAIVCVETYGTTTSDLLAEDVEETVAVLALLHDVCKAQFYKVSSRNVKNPETGRWEAQPYFSIDDQFPFGHGEKSVFLIERFLRLKPSEAVAIRWHMGGFDDAARGGSFSISQAYEKYPLAVKLHLADVYSTYLKEKGTSAMR